MNIVLLRFNQVVDASHYKESHLQSLVVGED